MVQEQRGHMQSHVHVQRIQAHAGCAQVPKVVRVLRQNDRREHSQRTLEGPQESTRASSGKQDYYIYIYIYTLTDVRALQAKPVPRLLWQVALMDQSLPRWGCDGSPRWRGRGCGGCEQLCIGGRGVGCDCSCGVLCRCCGWWHRRPEHSERRYVLFSATTRRWGDCIPHATHHVRM